MSIRPLRFLSLGGVFALVACASDPRPVHLTSGAIVPIEATGAVHRFYEDVANIDLDDGVSSQETRILSRIGREDLIPDTGRDYTEAKCNFLEDREPISEILSKAQETQIVIINEPHSRSRGRALTTKLFSGLRALGYSNFGAEAFSNYPGEQFAESEQVGGDDHRQPFPLDTDGYYTRESVFGRLVREALVQDYHVFAYEMEIASAADIPTDPVEQINLRDGIQAENIYRQVFDQNPDAKLVLHVGYAHARESPQIVDGREILWLAARLKERTGIDPLTINQTECRGGKDYILAEPLGEDEAFDRYDLYVNLPNREYSRHRPLWRKEMGDVFTDLPDEFRPEGMSYIIEARIESEPDSAVPIDRVWVRPDEDVALSLPPGNYRIRAVEIPLTE